MDYWMTVSDWRQEEEQRARLAAENFRAGYNCAQSVALAFADAYGIGEPLMARIAASFGAGIGRMRETCGAACAIFLLAGLEVSNAADDVLPHDAPESLNPYPDISVKRKDYEVVQRLAADFRSAAGSIVCRELLGLNKLRADGKLPQIAILPDPEPRTEEYYRKRPCVRMVETAARIYVKYLREKYSRGAV